MTTTDTKKRNNARWQLIAIAAVFILPWVAAFLWTPSGRVNNGELIEPIVPLPEISLRDSAREPVAFSSLKSRWLLLTTADSQCMQACEKTLYAMRQVRLALGKHAPRVRSVLLTRQSLPQDVLNRYQTADPNLVILTQDGTGSDGVEVLFRAQKPSSSAADGILLIDPEGNLMMRYEVGFEPKLIRKDLSRLLKASRIG